MKMIQILTQPQIQDIPTRPQEQDSSQMFDVISLFNIPYRTNYTPDYSDPRTKKRVIKVLSTIYRTFGPNSKSSVMLTQEYLRDLVGNTSRGLGAFIKNSLFVCTDSYYSKDDHVAMKYGISWKAFNALARKVFDEESEFILNEKLLKSAVLQATEKFQKEIDLLKEGNLHYKIKSNRFYTSVQNIPKEIKIRMLADAGFQFQYDTECAAASLLYRHAKKLGFKGNLDSIFEYIENKSTIRNNLSAKTGLDIKTVKMIITALFSGSVLARNDHSCLYRAICEEVYKDDIDDPINDPDRITKLIQDDPFIIGLKKNISDMWKFLKLEDEILQKKVSLKIGSTRLTASDKWCLYFKLEQRVLIAIIAYAYVRDILSLFEHDGFCTNKKIDLKDLREFIKEKTGYEIKITYDFIPSLVTKVLTDANCSTSHPIVSTISGSLFDPLFNGFKTRNSDLLKTLINNQDNDQEDMDFISDCFFIPNKAPLVKSDKLNEQVLNSLNQSLASVPVNMKPESNIGFISILSSAPRSSAYSLTKPLSDQEVVEVPPESTRVLIRGPHHPLMWYTSFLNQSDIESRNIGIGSIPYEYSNSKSPRVDQSINQITPSPTNVVHIFLNRITGPP